MTIEHGQSSSYRKRMLEAEATLEQILDTLDHPHDHAYSEIEHLAREWEKNRNHRYKPTRKE